MSFPEPALGVPTVHESRRCRLGVTPAYAPRKRPSQLAAALGALALAQACAGEPFKTDGCVTESGEACIAVSGAAGAATSVRDPMAGAASDDGKEDDQVPAGLAGAPIDVVNPSDSVDAGNALGDDALGDDDATPSDDPDGAADDNSTTDDDNSPADDDAAGADDDAVAVDDDASADDDNSVPDDDNTVDDDAAGTDGDSAIPDDDTAVPDDDTAVPDDDISAADDDTAVPDDDTSAADDDTSVPDDDTAVPDDDTSAADDDTSVVMDECPDNADQTVAGVCGCGFAPDPLCDALGAALRNRYAFQGTGSSIEDSVGSAHGTAVDAELTGTGQLELDGVSGYVELPSGLLDNLESATFETWLRWDGGREWQRVVDFGSSTGDRPESYFFITPKSAGDSSNGNGITASYSHSGGASNQVYARTHVDFPQGRTAQLTIVVQHRDRIQFYLDGESKGGMNTSIDLSRIVDTTNWLGHSRFSADTDLKGALLEFRIYNKALSSQEVQKSFALGPDAPLTNAP